jgi:drug/metabolite transporter (DMT)-like permease
VAKRPLENVDPLLLSAIVYPISFAALVPITKSSIAVEESSLSSPLWPQIIDSLLLIKPSEWLIIIAMSAFGFAGALSLLLESLKRIGTIRTMMIFSLTPIFGIIAANIVHAETISILEAIATGIIIIGIFMVSKS